ncbi:hypothetical protein, partial [Salmonella sp. s51228]|uniref:hypothetical protein n=1 Tax=Salmonella sp. s51228 TaxID=3159652 RepID=UPI003980DE22
PNPQNAGNRSGNQNQKRYYNNNPKGNQINNYYSYPPQQPYQQIQKIEPPNSLVKCDPMNLMLREANQLNKDVVVTVKFEDQNLSQAQQIQFERVKNEQKRLNLENR